MLLKFVRFFSLLTFLASYAWAQDGKIAGTVTDAQGGAASFATVIVFNEGYGFVGGAQCSEEGTYSIAPVEPGSYNVVFKYVDKVDTVKAVPVNPNQTRRLDYRFKGSDPTLDEVEITASTFDIPVFELDAPSGQTIGNDEITKIGTRDVNALVTLTPGVQASDEGDNSIRIRGARANGTVYYVDGQKIRGGVNLPQSAISTLQVITGGTPAEFGDFTGGVVSITTSKPAGRLSGSAEFVTSEFLDPFGRNLGAISISGPLLKKTKTIVLGDKEEKVKIPLLGYFIAVEGDYNRDRRPSINDGNYRLKPYVLADFQQTPLQLSSNGGTFLSRANFVTFDDLEQFDAKPNLEARGKVLARIDFQPTDNITVKLGGNVEMSDQDVFSLANEMFAPEANSNFQSNTYRGWMRFQQNFKGGPESTLKNFFYVIQGDYSRYQRLQQNNIHEGNLFDYGYVGKFTFDRNPVYFQESDPSSSISSRPYWITRAYQFQNLQFDPSDTRNPILANYNTQIFDYVANNGILNPFPTLFNPDPTINNLQNLNNLAFVQGIQNGGSPPSIYGMYSGVGQNFGTFSKQEFDQFRLTGQATAELGSHNIRAGFEFEQRVERSYGINARALWTFMRRFTNFHFATNLEDDPSRWEYVFDPATGLFQDTINVPNAVDLALQFDFDRKLREQLGLDPDGSDFINIDGFGPENYTLDMFTADELLNDGNGIIDYYGYDYLGNRQDRVANSAFFDNPDDKPMNAYSPTYIAAFIQDKFEFEDIIFNIGFRVDRFDANQPVLRDPYSLYPTFQAGETAQSLGLDLPTGVENDWTAYVDNALNPTRVLGYRDGDSWFDADGAPISSQIIVNNSPGGRTQPHIKEDRVSIESFQDYPIQTVFMPRISFSFPISDVAVFNAHYDVLSQRPGQNLAFTGSSLAGQLSDYAFLENRPTIGVGNPNLRPEITVDYEVGFKQKIGERMALSIAAFYREMRNMVRFRRFINAYPFTYDTQDNLDYGTTKGLQLSYDMRRAPKGNVSLRAAYTLQFATETGATAGAARNLATNLEGASVLRVPVASSADIRHAVVGVVDYRLFNAQGPSIKLGKKVIYPLANAGANLRLNLNTGTPFSQSAFAVPTAVSGTPISQVLEGTLNGKRLPTNFRADLRLDKIFSLGGKQKEDGSITRSYAFNFYLTILNVLNQRNVLGVYRYTGLPDDDGYLNSDVGQQDIQFQINPATFSDLYQIRVNSPFNITRPRTIQLGLLLSF
jgi:outer membrane receptor protein involved in Fe transport